MENSEEFDALCAKLTYALVSTLKKFEIDDEFTLSAMLTAMIIVGHKVDVTKYSKFEIDNLTRILTNIGEKKQFELNAPKVDKVDNSGEKSPVGFDVKYKRIRPDWMRVIEGGRPW